MHAVVVLRVGRGAAEREELGHRRHGRGEGEAAARVEERGDHKLVPRAPGRSVGDVHRQCEERHRPAEQPTGVVATAPRLERPLPDSHRPWRAAQPSLYFSSLGGCSTDGLVVVSVRRRVAAACSEIASLAAAVRNELFTSHRRVKLK